MSGLSKIIKKIIESIPRRFPEPVLIPIPIPKQK